MAANDHVILSPLIYGYVYYAAPKSGSTIHFSDSREFPPMARPGSTLGAPASAFRIAAGRRRS
jgi:multiple sugar transport system substrate-binding protein